jgi:hypothetical protein
MPQAIKFNYAAAKAAGFTDEQIAQSLAAKRAQGLNVYVDRAEVQSHRGSIQPVPSHVPPGLSPTRRAVGATFDALSATSPYGPMIFPTTTGAPLLPGIGMTAGGLMLGPGGAGLGAMTGKAAERAVTGQPPSLTAMGGAAAQGMGWELGGQAIWAGLNAFARPLMRSGLRILPTLAAKFGMKPKEIAEVVLREHPPNMAEAEQFLREKGAVAAGKRNARLQAFKGPISSGTLSKQAILDAERFANRPFTAAEKADLIAQMEYEANQILTEGTHGVIGRSGPRFSAHDVEMVKEVAANKANPAYAAARAGRSTPDPVLMEQLAGGARERLARIPGVAPINTHLAELKAARLAAEHAATMKGTWSQARIGPLPIPGVKLPPEGMGNLALRLSSPRFQALIRRSPTAAAAIIQQMFQEGGP